MQGLYDAAREANELLVKAEGDPETRIRTAITLLFDSVDSQPAHLPRPARGPGVERQPSGRCGTPDAPTSPA